MIELKQVTFQYDNAPENAHSIRNINLTIQTESALSFADEAAAEKQRSPD